ncbi:MAG: ABC transporter ATP-binding protein/permease [Anaerolineae bacterium]|nr:ABC transporter ATP-binding protein/permease [Anaerolineae bacterium]MDH7472905.1 ABC transporter ATP-binding protein [Anaerolineae bacterium]
MESLRRMLQFLKPYKWQSILALALLLGMVIADLLIPRLTQRVINQGIAKGDMRLIVSTALLMLGAAALSALFAVANTVLSVRVAQNVSADLRSALVRKVQTFSFGNLDRIQTGQLLVRATSDVNQVQTIVQMALRMLTRAPLWILGSMVMLITTSAQLSLLMLSLLPLILGLIWFFAVKARPLFMLVQGKLDKLNQVLQENLAGVRVVKAFVRDEHENARFDRANRELMAENIRVMQFLAVLIPSMSVLVNLGVAGVIWFGGGAAISGNFTLGEIVASVNYMTYSLFPLIMLGSMIGPLSAADASAERIWEVLDSSAEVQDSPGARPLPSITGRVAFEDVCFSYNSSNDFSRSNDAVATKVATTSDELVLEGINLVAEPGQTVAILGATGAGKSSLIHLIPRFYDVEQGRVTLDGVDVRDIPLDVLRAQIGIALQETVLFSGTVCDNIRYGRPDATDEEVIAAAKAAQAHEFIMSFPQGYDTVLGQRGVNLSGGQKQRIAIARALLVRPKILILDDSTSAVDVETEAQIEAALEELKKNCTTFVIAQRISTVLNADKIVVLERGKIVAVGTHAELMASSPIYREIYESQLGNGVLANG